MYNNNIRTDSEIHQFINSEFRNDRLRLESPLENPDFLTGCGYQKMLLKKDFNSYRRTVSQR